MKVNKSHEVRAILAKDPTMKPVAIVEQLAKRGIKMSPAFASVIKGNVNKKERQEKRKVVKATVLVDPIALIGEIKSLAGRAGGYDKLQQLVEVLAK